MQKAILVKDEHGVVIAKKVYAGDTSVADAEFVHLVATYPTYTFVKYDDDQTPEFVNAVCANPKNVD